MTDAKYENAGNAARHRLAIRLAQAEERHAKAVELAATRSRIARISAYIAFDKEGEKALNACLARDLVRRDKATGKAAKRSLASEAKRNG
jgi:hypothetical protein